MATIQKTQDEKSFIISNWLGLHESPDGDAEIRTGESPFMKNLMITVDGNLRTRPGLNTVITVPKGNSRGLWTGVLYGEDVIIGCFGNKLYEFWDSVNECFYDVPVQIGQITTTSGMISFCASGDDLYFLDGYDYYKITEYQESLAVQSVLGYIPVVLTNCKADGTGEVFENVNRLNNLRRLWWNGDNESTSWIISDSACNNVTAIINRATGAQVTNWTYDIETNTVTLDGVLPTGYNNYEVYYAVANSYRSQVTSMKYAILHSGSTDNLMCLYGDGSSKFIYSGSRWDNGDHAEYFPDLYESEIGSNDDPIMGMCRNYSQLIIFKTRETFSGTFSYTTLENELSTPMWTIYPVNSTIGSSVMGEVQQCENAPYTFCNSRVYEWRNQSGRSTSITRDERHAKYKSEKVYKSMEKLNTKGTWLWDCNKTGELFVFNGRNAYVYRYNEDIWYFFQFAVTIKWCIEFKNRIYMICDEYPEILEYSISAVVDRDELIEQYWESGSMSFGSPHKRKSTKAIWITMIPKGNTEVTVEIETDRVGAEREKELTRTTFSFNDIIFGTDFTFIANSRVKTHKLKLKAKKFTHYKVKLKCDTIGKGMDVLSFATEYRETGEAK